MEKEFVNYNQALKLKALGFDEPCLGLFYDGNFQQIYSEIQLDTFILAPTWQSAFRWVREKYNLFGTPQYFTGGFYCYTINDMKDTKESNKLFTEFETYEEAEIACLERLIELIESKSE